MLDVNLREAQCDQKNYRLDPRCSGKVVNVLRRLSHEASTRHGSRDAPGYDRDLFHDDGTKDLLGPTESRSGDIDEIVRPSTAAMPPSLTAAQEFGKQLGDTIAVTPGPPSSAASPSCGSRATSEPAERRAGAGGEDE